MLTYSYVWRELQNQLLVRCLCHSPLNSSSMHSTPILEKGKEEEEAREVEVSSNKVRYANRRSLITNCSERKMEVLDEQWNGWGRE